MKQLTILCSPDLEDRVIEVLDSADVEGFLHLPGGSANLFADPGRVPRTLTWEAVVLLVQAVEDAQAERVADALETLARECGSRTCLRFAAGPVDRAF